MSGRVKWSEVRELEGRGDRGPGRAAQEKQERFYVDGDNKNMDVLERF